MTVSDASLLVGAAFGAGVMNAVAGGGTFLTLPALILAGVPAKVANATSTVALWPGSIASTYGYRRELRGQPRLLPLGIVSLIGGVLGAQLLRVTGETTFQRLIPWLMLVATVLFAAGPALSRRLRRNAAAHVGDVPAGHTPLAALAGQFVIAVYGGYFGAGIGILMLAALALAGMDDLHAMNGLKNALATAINAVAFAVFVYGGLILWPEAAVMTVGSVAGGLCGVRLARRLPTPVTRAAITTIGTVLTAWFFFKMYGPA